MSDYRVVQCFGVKHQRGKKDKACRKRFLWKARALGNNFGGKGVQACPNCGTLPDFRHPYNRWLDGEINMDEAEAAMPDFREQLEKDSAK